MSESNSPDLEGTQDKPVTHWLRGGPVVSSSPRDRPLGLEGAAAAGMANAAVLGLWTFATGTWMLAVVSGGYLPAADLHSLAPVSLFITGFAQFIAGLLFFNRANMFAATAFGSFGALHVTTGLMFLLNYVGVITDHTGMSLMLGYLIESFSFIAFALMVAVIRANLTLTLITCTTGIGAALLGITEFNGGASQMIGVAHAGGAVLFLDAGLAYYLGAAIVINSSFERVLLPTFGEL